MIFYQSDRATLHCGSALDVLREMPANSVHCCVTSPPYWSLREYGTEPQVWPDGWRGELGLEPNVSLFLAHLVAIFDQVRRVLHPSGTCWINFGDSYACKPNGRSAAATRAAGNDDRTFRDKPNVKARAPVGQNGKHGYSGEQGPSRSMSHGFKEKDRIGQPHRLVFALQDAGWWWRDEIVWRKAGPMPSSVTDRTTCQHEFMFMLTKSAHYHYDQFAIRERAVYPAGTRAAKGSEARAEHANGRPPEYAIYDGWRNKRSVWDVNTEPSGVEHYAAYPRDLVKPCVMAGTSEKGYCSECGAPWKRLVRKSGGTTGKDWNPAKSLEMGNSSASRADNGDGSYRVESLGWQATCKHNAPVVPCRVLDPFLGTGTTGVVALELGRHFVGIELSPKYCKIARKRLQGARQVIPGLGEEVEEPDCKEAWVERQMTLMEETA